MIHKLVFPVLAHNPIVAGGKWTLMSTSTAWSCYLMIFSSSSIDFIALARLSHAACVHPMMTLPSAISTLIWLRRTHQLLMLS